MLTLQIEFLTGRYYAATADDRSSAEWPPHPARLFSALVDAWASDDQDPVEKQALLWLENQSAPAIEAGQATARTVVPHYVPVNDAGVVGFSQLQSKSIRLEKALSTLEKLTDDESKAGERKRASANKAVAKERDVAKMTGSRGKTNPADALSLLPENRSRQLRVFPSVGLTKPLLRFTWPHAAPDAETISALDSLLQRVSRLGHSSSLVNATIHESSRPNWIPDTEGRETLRWIQPGQLLALERSYSKHQGIKPRRLPAQAIRYRTENSASKSPTKAQAIKPSTAGHCVIYEFPVEQRILPATRAVELSQAVRGALLHHANDSQFELLSGHHKDGKPTRKPHLSIVPLPDIGHQHASGQIKGFALVVPGGENVDELPIYAAMANWQQRANNKLLMGRLGAFNPERIDHPSLLRTLQIAQWRGPCRHWVSATPVALPRSPGPLTRGSVTKLETAWRKAEDTVVQSCYHIGLPTPERLELSLAPVIRGGDKTSAYPAFSQGSPALKRTLVHVCLSFPSPVEGPLLLGSGRFYGLGLMKPVSEEKKT